MVGRRDFLKVGALGGAAVLPGGVLGARAYAAPAHGSDETDAPVPQTPPLKKYVDPLPRPKTAVADPSVYPGADYYEVTMRQGSWRFHRDLGPAKVWGYWAANPHDPDQAIGMGYLGPTIDVTRDHPTVVKWRNELPTTHMFQSVVDRIRNGDPQLTPIAPPPYEAKPPFPSNVNVWNVVHQHGGYTAPQSDGMPMASYSSDGVHGEHYTTLDPKRVEPNEAIYAYTNHERSCLLWYHDHGMGLTSLNVYAGLAGLYRVGDPADDRLGLPDDAYEIPLILQDRTFNKDGSLAYTMTQQEGEDTPVVNGKAYPFLAVEPRRYRLRVLNASNERFFRLRFDTPRDVLLQPILPFWLIGTDGGLRAPLRMLDFLIAPAERYDLIVDFSGMPEGTNVTLTNFHAPVHYPGGGGPDIGEVMQFQVTERLAGGKDRSTPPEKLDLPGAAPVKVTSHTRRREFVLYQHKLFSTMTINAVPFMEPSQDFVKRGSTEIWEYVNPNHDAHPMHVHLVNFQVLNRQPIDAAGYQAQYEKWVYGGPRGRGHAGAGELPHRPPGPAGPGRGGLQQGHGQVLPRDGDPYRHLGVHPAHGHDRVDPGQRGRTPGDVHPPLPHPGTRGRRPDASVDDRR